MGIPELRLEKTIGLLFYHWMDRQIDVIISKKHVINDGSKP